MIEKKKRSTSHSFLTTINSNLKLDIEIQIYKYATLGHFCTFRTVVRSPQDFDVLAVLNFQIPCFRPEIQALYLRCLLTLQDVRDGFRDENESFKIQDGEDVDVLRSPDSDSYDFLRSKIFSRAVA